MQKFKEINGNDIVYIIKDDGNGMLILSNGLKAKKEYFERSFTPINDIDSSQMINQINETKKTLERMSQSIPNYTPEGINPDDFFAPKPLLDVNQIKSNLANLDTSRILDTGQTTVKMNPGNDFNDMNIPLDTSIKPVLNQQQTSQSVIAAETPDQQQARMTRMLEEARQMQNNAPAVLDENDPDFDKKVAAMQNQRPQKQTNLNENGLTEAQEIARQNQISATGIDPFADKVATYKAQNQQKQIQVVQEQKNVQIQQKQEETKVVQQQLDSPQAISDDSSRKIVSENIVALNNNVIESDDYKMFRKFKNVNDIKINIELNETITDLTMVKQMFNYYEEDILRFYAKKYLNNIMKDIDKLENNIYDQIYKEVFGAVPAKKVVKEPKIVPASKVEVKKPQVKSKPKSMNLGDLKPKKVNTLKLAKKEIIKDETSDK